MGGPQAALLEAPTLTTGVDHWKPWSADSQSSYLVGKEW